MNLNNYLETGAYSAAIAILGIALIFTIIMIVQIKKELKKIHNNYQSKKEK